ncbi:hypothetical protein ACLGL1_06845 [Peptococcus simiae]|uniref:hypothetical protein n=1 Tax=Peptococcus simiae TaxID=1643805 RepID=UPI00397F9A50
MNKEIRENIQLREDLFDIYESLELIQERGTLPEFLENSLAIEYTKSIQGLYLGCLINITSGGPTIDIDTRRNLIVGSWGETRVEYPLPDGIASNIDELISETVEVIEQK